MAYWAVVAVARTAGTAIGDVMAESRRLHLGLTLIVNDVIAHVTHPPGLMANIMTRVMRFGLRKPQTPRVVERMLVKDPKALSSQFAEWSSEENLRRIIPSHGEIISDPKEALASLALG
jgi:hypothetical protein